MKKFIMAVSVLIVFGLLLSFKTEKPPVDTVLIRLSLNELDVVVEGIRKLPIERGEVTLYNIRVQANQQLAPMELPKDTTHRKDSIPTPKKKK